MEHSDGLEPGEDLMYSTEEVSRVVHTTFWLALLFGVAIGGVISWLFL